MRFYVVSVGDTTSPAFLTLGEQQQQTANCEVRNQKGRGRKGAVSPIPELYPNFLAVAEVTRRRPTALSTWLFVTPQRFAGLRKRTRRFRPS